MTALRNDALAGRHAIVTGGARGIGLAIARRYLAAGASVALWDLDASVLANAPRTLAPLGTATSAVVDVRDEDQVARAAAQSQERFGGIDILVNNAGVLGPTVPAWEHTPAQWRNVLDVNLTGAWLCCRAVAPVMLARAAWPHRQHRLGCRQGGQRLQRRLLGLQGRAHFADQVARQGAGCIGRAGELHHALGGRHRSVRGRARRAPRTAAHRLCSRRVPMGRFVEVDEVAAMAAWLASDDCSFSTGAVFDISGGRSMY